MSSSATSRQIDCVLMSGNVDAVSLAVLQGWPPVRHQNEPPDGEGSGEDGDAEDGDQRPRSTSPGERWRIPIRTGRPKHRFAWFHRQHLLARGSVGRPNDRSTTARAIDRQASGASHRARTSAFAALREAMVGPHIVQVQLLNNAPSGAAGCSALNLIRSTRRLDRCFLIRRCHGERQRQASILENPAVGGRS
jgi:hypothetical protein